MIILNFQRIFFCVSWENNIVYNNTYFFFNLLISIISSSCYNYVNECFERLELRVSSMDRVNCFKVRRKRK